MEYIWRLCFLTILLPLSWAALPDNVTLTIEPADTIMEGGMFQVCTDTSDFDGNITFTYSISPSTGLNMASGVIPAGNCSMDITVADNCYPSNGVVLSVTVTATVNGSQTQEIVNVTVSDNDTAVAAVLSVTTVDLIESEDAVVCVSIPSPACENTVFQLGTANASDYNIAPSGNVTILMGNTEQCITVSTNMTEAEETFVITWQPSLPYVNFTDGNQINVTIRQRPTITFKQSTYSFPEGSNMQTVPIMLNEALGPGRNAIINVTYSGGDSRFSLQNNTVTFSDGQTSVPVTVIISDDNVVEMNVNIMLRITIESGLVKLGSTNTTLITITDNDVAMISLPPSETYNESSNSNRLCLRSSLGIIGGVNVTFDIITSSAKENMDFMTAQSAVMIQSNNTGEFCVTITVTDDNIIEPDELFSINWNLTENFNGRVNLSNSMTEITITDNDSGMVLVPESRSFSKITSDRDICITVPALGLKPDGTSYQLDYSITGSQGDFNVTPSVLSISSNTQSTPCITLNIIDDSLVEGNETFTVTWTLGSGVPSRLTLNRNTTTITILDNDVAVVGFDPVAYTVREGQSVDVMVRVLHGELQTTISITARTENVSGVIPVNQIITFSNATLVDMFSVVTVDDKLVSGNRSFTLMLSSSDSLVQIMNGTATINVIEDDVPPTVQTPSPSNGATGGLTTPILIGIIVGGVALAILALFIVILCVCIARLRFNRQGFYFTNEDKSEAPQMLRYSASLRSISSQTVMPIDGRDKENEYMV